jgi:hypothetical protein
MTANSSARPSSTQTNLLHGELGEPGDEVGRYGRVTCAETLETSPSWPKTAQKDR